MAKNGVLAELLQEPFGFASDRRQKETDFAKEIVPEAVVEAWAESGVRIRRGLISSETCAKLMVEVSNGDSAARLHLEVRKNGALPHLETQFFGTRKPKRPPLVTRDDLLVVTNTLARLKSAQHRKKTRR
jgi:hypothetical protein